MIAIRTLCAFTLAAGLVAFAPLPSVAGPGGDAFGQCLVGQTTGDDRILLVRWMTFAFAAHPAVQDAVTVDSSKIDGINRAVGQLVTDLLTTRCVKQAKAAVAETGEPSIAFQSAFQVLGQAASQEALLSPQVNASISAFVNYIDQNALTNAIQP
jgi:hypothetical protein